MVDALLVGAEELENLATRYLASVLRQHGYTVELAAFSSADEARTVLWQAALAQPRLVGLSIIFQYRAPEFLALARELKELLPGVHITAGGHFPSFAAAELLRDYPALDSVVRGEGELTLLELVQNLATRKRWGGIAGLSFRDQVTSEPVLNPNRALISDLDSLPLPARDSPPQHHLGVGYAPILSSRGCSHNCTFCSIHSFYASSRGRLQRFRSVGNVVDEMEQLYHARGVRFFVFNDDEWFPPGRARYTRTEAFGRELARRGMRLIMSIKCRADDVERELFRQLQEIGVVRAYVGVESGSDRSLATMNKGTSAQQNRHALEVLQEIGMLADFGMITFDPYSTVSDIRANIDFMRQMGGSGLAPLSLGRMEIYAGTAIERRLMAEGRLSGGYMARNYVIPDARVEMLWRLLITAMRHRHYDSSGMGKQTSIAYYELMMCEYLHGQRRDGALRAGLQDIVASLNNHSLGIFEEMLEFATQGSIRDAHAVNARAEEWSRVVALADVELQQALDEWRRQVAARPPKSAG